jgi:hypothetical protein
VRTRVFGRATASKQQPGEVNAKIHVEALRVFVQSPMAAEETQADETVAETTAQQTPDETVASGDDPRLHDDHVREIDAGGENRVTLVGVVHDHPASRYRVHELVGEAEPAVLAVEVPPLALPLFEQYAADGRDLPAFGGEVSAAIAPAGPETRVVGIDGVDGLFCRRFLEVVHEDRSSLAAVRSVLGGVGSVLHHATQCRLAAELARVTGLRVEVDRPVEHECTLADPPAVQADNEGTFLDRATALMCCADPPEAVALRDRTREACMADRLRALRAEGDVVAVVGHGHLAALADRLRG